MAWGGVGGCAARGTRGGLRPPPLSMARGVGAVPPLRLAPSLRSAWRSVPSHTTRRSDFLSPLLFPLIFSAHRPFFSLITVHFSSPLVRCCQLFHHFWCPGMFGVRELQIVTFQDELPPWGPGCFTLFVQCAPTSHYYSLPVPLTQCFFLLLSLPSSLLTPLAAAGLSAMPLKN